MMTHYKHPDMPLFLVGTLPSIAKCTGSSGRSHSVPFPSAGLSLSISRGPPEVRRAEAAAFPARGRGSAVVGGRVALVGLTARALERGDPVQAYLWGQSYTPPVGTDRRPLPQRVSSYILFLFY